MNTNQLIIQCISGDRRAQRSLFDQYYKYIYTICFRYVRNHHDVEDVVSEVFNRVFRSLDKLEHADDQGLKKWIQTISINEALRFVKRKHPIDYAEDDLQFEAAYEEPDISQIDERILKKAIDELPDGYRNIFLLNVVEGLSHTEIAEYLGISRNTSKSQMLKARILLQKKLKKDVPRQLR